LYVVEIKLSLVKLILFMVKARLEVYNLNVHDFSAVHIAPTVYVVHDAQKLV
jgi:hypothetical protein